MREEVVPPSQSRSMSPDFDRRWWEQTWKEREDAIWQAFGESQPDGAPAGYVTSIAFKDLPLPGACIYTFRPMRVKRPRTASGGRTGST